MDQSLPEQYVNWLQSLVRGERGFSVAYKGPVGPLPWPRVRNILRLTVPATVLAWLIAVPIGIWAASRKRGWVGSVAAGATKGPGNLRPTIFDHHALWNVEELFWRGRPSGAPQ